MSTAAVTVKAQAEDVIDAVDAKRQELEANVNKLRSALQHWRKWEIDYGELQEKLEDVSNSPSFDDLKRIRDSIDATLITDREVQELLGTDNGISRDRDQINALIARRVDYVQHNAQSLQKQLDAADAELTRLSGVEDAEFNDEEGLPITEILEELDDDGNVVSGRTSTAKDVAAGAAGLLSKAGVKDWVDPSPADEVMQTQDGPVENTGDSRRLETTTPSPSNIESAASGPAKAAGRKKSVAFAADIDIAPAPARYGSSPPPVRSASPPPAALPPTPIKSRPNVPWEVAEARKGRFHSGTRVIELNEDDAEIGSLPVVPPEDFEETEEESRLRREMTEYALNEVGAIVAEMDIDEGSDYDMDDDDDDESRPVEDRSIGSDEEDENEFGMTAFDRISDEDRKQMLELEKKLQAKVMQNLGPAPSIGDMDVDANDLRRLVVKPDEKNDAGDKSRRSSKVHFADGPEFLPTPQGPESAASDKPTVAESIVERRNGTKATEEVEPSKKKPSRFKSAMAGDVRSAAKLQSESQRVIPGQSAPVIPIHMRDEEFPVRQRPEAPTGPAGQVLSSTVLERPTRPNAVLPPDEAGMDPALMQQELAVENRRLFNKMVQQQGGFKPSPEDEDNPLMEEEDGKVRKVSRFKAARINAGGI